jgi:hypothetical protein
VTIEYIAHRYYGAPINDWGMLTDEICTDRDRCMDFVTESLKQDYPSTGYHEATPRNVRVLVVDHAAKTFDDKTAYFCAEANKITGNS